MSVGKKFKDWFFENDDDFEASLEIEDLEEDELQQPAASLFEKPKSNRTSAAMKTMSMGKDSQMVLFEPRSYAEAQGIADRLKEKRATVVNLHRLQKDQSKRIIDFLSGVVYAIDGDIQKIGGNIFLCTPKSFGVAGAITMDEKDEFYR